MLRRMISLVALLLAGVAGLGAARAPGEPALTLTGPAVVALSERVTYTVQLSGLGADPPAGTSVVVTLPAGVNYVPADDQIGTCTGYGTQVITCLVDEATDPLRWTLSTVFFSATMKVGDQLTLSAVAGDLSATLTATVGPGADLGITEIIGPKLPLTAGRPFRYTVVVHNYGPGTARYMLLTTSLTTRWFPGDGKIINGPGECFFDDTGLICDIPGVIEPGGEVRIEYELRTLANTATWGTKDDILIRVYDFPSSEPSINPQNDNGRLLIAFAPKPAGADPAPDPDGGLPVTGPAAGPLTTAGAILLLIGAALLGATRLRRRRS